MHSRTLPSAAAAAITFTLLVAGLASAGAPSTVWVAPNPGGLAAHVGAVAWSPDGNLVATGLSDRWVRLRRATDGQQVATIFQPHRSHGVVRLLFSNDGAYLVVGNASGTGLFRVYRVSSLAFLGQLTGTVDGRGIVKYAADAQLASAGAAGALSNWKLAELPVSTITGSGYDKVATRFWRSPNGSLQAAVSKATVTIRRTSDASVVKTVAGETVAFSADSTLLAAWTSSPNRTTIYRTSDFATVRTLTSPSASDGGISLRFTASGSTLVAAGYLPFVKPDGSWDQTGILRFWRVSDGALRASYNQGLSLGVTSGLAFSPSGSRFAVGVYDGTTIAAVTPA